MLTTIICVMRPSHLEPFGSERNDSSNSRRQVWSQEHLNMQTRSHQSTRRSRFEGSFLFNATQHELTFYRFVDRPLFATFLFVASLSEQSRRNHNNRTTDSQRRSKKIATITAEERESKTTISTTIYKCRREQSR